MMSYFLGCLISVLLLLFESHDKLVYFLSDIRFKREEPQAECDLVGHLRSRAAFQYGD